MTQAYNRDCMEAMREFPDKYFDLAVVDPPYGGGCSQTVHVERERERELHGGGGEYKGSIIGRFGGHFARYYLGDEDRRNVGDKVPPTNTAADIRNWDVAPQQEYFTELARVSRAQIIWGGNYFSLPPTRCFLVWDKVNITESFTMAMCEYAWTSFNDNAKLIRITPQGTSKKGRIHPTQKPVALYAWIFARYAKPGYKILDTHLGSGSSRIAAHDAGLDFWGYEISKTYFDLQERRFADYTAQLRMEPIQEAIAIDAGGKAKSEGGGQMAISI